MKTIVELTSAELLKISREIQSIYQDAVTLGMASSITLSTRGIEIELRVTPGPIPKRKKNV